MGKDGAASCGRGACQRERCPGKHERGACARDAATAGKVHSATGQLQRAAALESCRRCRSVSVAIEGEDGSRQDIVGASSATADDVAEGAGLDVGDAGIVKGDFGGSLRSTRALAQCAAHEVVEVERTAEFGNVGVGLDVEKAAVIDDRIAVAEEIARASPDDGARVVERALLERLDSVTAHVQRRANGNTRDAARRILCAAGPVEVVDHRQCARATQSARALREREDARAARERDRYIRIQDRDVARAGHYIAGPVHRVEPIGIRPAARIPSAGDAGGEDSGKLRRVAAGEIRGRSGDHAARWHLHIERRGEGRIATRVRRDGERAHVKPPLAIPTRVAARAAVEV